MHYLPTFFYISKTDKILQFFCQFSRKFLQHFWGNRFTCMGGGPQDPPPPFIVSKRTMVTQDFLIHVHKSCPPHTHTRVQCTEPLFASEKSCTRRKYMEWKHRAPKRTSYTPFGNFFFLLFIVRSLLLKISGSAYGLHWETQEKL